MEQVVTDAGETVQVPAAVKDRIKAAEIVLERGYGKVAQSITGEGGGDIVLKVINYGNNDPA